MTDYKNENKHQLNAFEDALVSFQKVLETVVQSLESDSASTRQEAYSFLQQEIAAKVDKILFEYEPKISSFKGMDYKSLKNFLSTGKWEKADEETLRIMLKISKREESLSYGKKY